MTNEITDDMVGAFIRAACGPKPLTMDAIRAGLAAAYAVRDKGPAPAVEVCRQGSHRDGDDAVTNRVRCMRNDQQSWTVDMCARHARHAANRMIRGGWRGVEIMPAGWTPDCTHGADCQVHRDANGLHNLHNLDNA